MVFSFDNTSSRLPMKSPSRFLLTIAAFSFTAVFGEDSEISFEKYDASFKKRLAQIEEAESARNREVLAAYKPRVQAVHDRAVREGNLDAVQTAKAELQRIEDETLTSESVEENTVPGLESLAPILKKQLRDSRDLRNREEREVIQTYIEALGRLQTALVQKGNVEEAVLAKKEVERLQRVLAKSGEGSVAVEFPSELETGMVLRYTFEEVSDGRVPNEKSSSWNGVVTGASSANDPEFGNCLEFHGDADRLAVTDELPDTDRFTVAAWINLASLDENAGIFSDYTSAGGNDTFFALQPKSGVFLRADKDGTALKGSVGFSKPWRDGWNHLVWVMDRSKSLVYLNGELTGELAQEGSNSGHHEAFFGHAHDGSKYSGLRGRMDEICFWRRTLSDSEVKSLFEFRP